MLIQELELEEEATVFDEEIRASNSGSDSKGCVSHPFKPVKSPLEVNGMSAWFKGAKVASSEYGLLEIGLMRMGTKPSGMIKSMHTKNASMEPPLELEGFTICTKLKNDLNWAYMRVVSLPLKILATKVPPFWSKCVDMFKAFKRKINKD